MFKTWFGFVLMATVSVHAADVPPLAPTTISRTNPPAPPARKMSEVAKVLGSEPQAAKNLAPLKILLCAGPKDHGPDEHDYPLWLKRWSQLLARGQGVTISTSMGFPSADQLAAADVAVFYNANPGWSTNKAATLDRFHERGGGAVYIHYAVDGGKEPAAAAERIGLAFTLGSRFAMAIWTWFSQKLITQSRVVCRLYISSTKPIGKCGGMCLVSISSVRPLRMARRSRSFGRSNVTRLGSLAASPVITCGHLMIRFFASWFYAAFAGQRDRRMWIGWQS